LLRSLSFTRPYCQTACAKNKTQVESPAKSYYREASTPATWNAVAKTNVTNNGSIIESRDVRIFFDVFDDAVMNSLDDNRSIRSTATSTPPTPILIADIMVIALLAAALDVAMLDSRSTAIMGKALTLTSLMPWCSIYGFPQGYHPSQT